MAYSKLVWKDHVTEHPRTYEVQENGDGTITLIPAPGEITQQGTPVSAENLNHMEDGIEAAHAAIAQASAELAGTIADVQSEVGDVQDDVQYLGRELGRIPVTNSGDNAVCTKTLVAPQFKRSGDSVNTGIVTLWTNASPNSEFQQQIIQNFPNNTYDLYLIYYKTSTDAGYYHLLILPKAEIFTYPNYPQGCLIHYNPEFDSSANANKLVAKGYRFVSFNYTTIQFGSAYKDGVLNNNAMIPLKICGVKL